jgi:hypothetical protein
VTVFADTAYTGLGTLIRVPFRRSRRDRATHRFVRRELSPGQLQVNRSIAALRGPGERANAELKTWRLLRKVRSSPAHASQLINAVQTVIINA